MFRNALAASLRHLYRGKLYAVIAVFGLAVGLCAALLAALYIRSQYSYWHFVSGYQDLYQVTMTYAPAERPRSYTASTPARLASMLQQRFPEVASTTRVSWEEVLLRLGDIEDLPPFSSVDPNFFDTVPLRVLAGDPTAALAQPDQLVITRAVARQYFGDDPPLGRTMEAVRSRDGSRQTVTVGAVIEDIPENQAPFAVGVLVSGVAAWTSLGTRDRFSQPFRSEMLAEVRTLVRLNPGASPQSLRRGLPQVVQEILGDASPESSGNPGLDLLRVDQVHTNPDYNPGFTGRVVMVAALALVILIIAAVNFVNLLTARSGARILEVGVRKLAGASRAALALQFFGEAFVQVVVAVVVAIAMTELLLPHANAFLVAGAEFRYWQEPTLLFWILLGTMVAGLVAGCWPALVLSGLRPLGAMHGARLARGGGGFFRQLLVSLQFALLSGLVIAAGVMYLQRNYAAEQALRFDTDQVLVLDTGCSPGRMTELRRLAGVRDAACSGSQLLGGEGNSNGIEGRTRDGRSLPMAGVWIDDRMLGLYGIEPLAGRVLAADDFEGYPGRPSTGFLINETAMRALGFDSPAAALGPYPLINFSDGRLARNGLDEIIGVVPDFSMAPVDTRIAPTVFAADPRQFSTISVKLKGTDIPATLAAIERVWKDTLGRGGDPPIGKLRRVFYDDRVELMYQSMLREARAFGIASLVAISLALLGLLGLAASMADQRTKEIGLRKALGATTGDVLRLLLWQFSKPVLWANLIAWPVAGYLVQRWLSGFAYRIDLPLWLFPAAALVVLLVALATVSAQALAVARLKPVVSLRHE